MVNFFEIFCACSPSILVQDPTVKISKIEKNSIFAYWARNGRFEHFFEKNDLRLLGINLKSFFILEFCFCINFLYFSVCSICQTKAEKENRISYYNCWCSLGHGICNHFLAHGRLLPNCKLNSKFFMLKVRFGLQILSILQQWSTILVDKIVGALHTLCITSISYNSSNSYVTSSLAHSCCSYETPMLQVPDESLPIVAIAMRSWQCIEVMMRTWDKESPCRSFKHQCYTSYCSIVKTSHLWILHFHLLSITSCTSVNIMTMSSSTFFTL